MNIRYKVVTTDNHSIFIYKHPFCTHYEENAILKDTKGMGFFCFKTKEAAYDFAFDFCRIRSIAFFKILEVYSLSEEHVPREIASNSYCIEEFYHRMLLYDTENLSTTCIPKGTICCKEIKVGKGLEYQYEDTL